MAGSPDATLDALHRKTDQADEAVGEPAPQGVEIARPGPIGQIGFQANRPR